GAGAKSEAGWLWAQPVARAAKARKAAKGSMPWRARTAWSSCGPAHHTNRATRITEALLKPNHGQVTRPTRARRKATARPTLTARSVASPQPPLGPRRARRMRPPSIGNAGSRLNAPIIRFEKNTEKIQPGRLGPAASDTWLHRKNGSAIPAR